MGWQANTLQVTWLGVNCLSFNFLVLLFYSKQFQCTNIEAENIVGIKTFIPNIVKCSQLFFEILFIHSDESW